MTLRKLLGLEESHMSDQEIIRKIHEAQRKHVHEIVFTCKERKVKLHLSDVEPKGIMNGYQGYYENGGS